jgi:hypothetical protein
MTPEMMRLAVQLLWQEYANKPSELALERLRVATMRYEDWLFTQ